MTLHPIRGSRSFHSLYVSGAGSPIAAMLCIDLIRHFDMRSISKCHLPQRGRQIVYLLYSVSEKGSPSGARVSGGHLCRRQKRRPSRQARQQCSVRYFHSGGSRAYDSSQRIGGSCSPDLLYKQIFFPYQSIGGSCRYTCRQRFQRPTDRK